MSRMADAPGDGKYIFKLGQPPVRGSQPIQVLVDVRHAVHSMISSFLMRRAQQSGVALISYTALRISSSLAELLQGLRVPFSLLLDGLLQQHILHLYGVSGLANANLSQAVPFIKVFSLSASHPSPRLTTCSHRRSGKNTVRPGSPSQTAGPLSIRPPFPSPGRESQPCFPFPVPMLETYQSRIAYQSPLLWYHLISGHRCCK